MPEMPDSHSVPAPETRSADDRQTFGRAAAISLLAHVLAVVGLSTWAFVRPAPERPLPELVRLTLVPPPLPAAMPTHRTLPSIEPEQADAEPPPAQANEPAPSNEQTRLEALDPTRLAEESSTAEAAAPEAPRIDLERLRRQLAERSEQDEPPLEPAPPGSALPSPDVPWTERGEAIRGLPIGGGWLNPYVGPVQPYSETWGSQIGERRGYYVLANGQAVCTRTPAPSFSELIHPWKAMRVTLAWDCGRVRGTAPPPDDLDYAPAPAALRNADERTAPAGTAVP